MSTTEPEILDLKPTSKEYLIQGAKYTAHELDTAGSVHYLNERAACDVYNDQGRLVNIKDIAALEPLLVSLGLKDPSGNPVPRAVIDTWPARITTKISEYIFKVSELGGTSDERVTLTEALNLLDSPVKPEVFFKWINCLSDRFKTLKRVFKDDIEELSKNVQSGTGAISS